MHQKKRNRELFLVTLLVCIVAILDFNLTLLLISPQPQNELNPIARSFIESHQYIELAILKITTTFVVIWCGLLLKNHAPVGKSYYVYILTVALINYLLIMWWSIVLWT